MRAAVFLCLAALAGCDESPTRGAKLGDPSEREAGAGSVSSGGAGPRSSADASSSGVGGALTTPPLADANAQGTPWDPDHGPVAGIDGSWGAPGFRSSAEPFGAARCRHAGVNAFSVWSEPSAVYLRVSTTVNTFGRQWGPEGMLVVKNDGSGWTEVMHSPDAGIGPSWGGPGLTGRLGGALLLYPFSPDCPFQRLDGSAATCVAGPSRTAMPEVWTAGVFVETSSLAHVVFPDSVYSFDGTEWTDLHGKTTTYGFLHGVWSAQGTVVVVGERQEIAVRTGANGRFERQPGVPPGDYTAVWGFSGDDVWTGNSAGQLVHFDGAAWRVVPNAGTCPNQPIVQLWGSGTTLYLHDGHRLVRWDGTRFDTILSGSCDENAIRGIWGNGESELFVALGTATCSVAWFDGRQVHQF